MRVIKSLLAMAFVLIGLVFGALNRQPVHVDAWVRGFDLHLGLLLLVVVLFGALLGGAAVTAGVVWPLRRRLHSKDDSKIDSKSDSASGPDALEVSGKGKDAWR